ncbi:MAG: hypothetical protein ACC612_11320 [Methanomethylovorans sp.]
MVLKLTQEQYDRLQAHNARSAKCRNAQYLHRDNKQLAKNLRGGVA